MRNLQRAQLQKGINVSHFDKVMLQDLSRCDPLQGVELQHGLDYVHKHQPICFLHHFVWYVAVGESTLERGETKSTFVQYCFVFFSRNT